MAVVKKTWLSIFNRLLSLLLVLLGFNSCDSDKDDEMILMYGMPPTRYDVKTNVLDQENNPIEGIRVSLKSEEFDNRVMGFGLTNAKGVFQSKVYTEKINIVCEDVDGKENGTFRKDSIQADLSEIDDSKFEFTIKLKSEE